MTKDTEEPKISHMSFSELVTFYAVHVARVDMTWFRIMYLHAAVVGVLIFFAEAEIFYWLQRGLVFAFYTVNLLIFHLCLQESYKAMQAARDDLAQFDKTDGSVDTWFRSMMLGHKTASRVSVLAITWALVGWLLFKDAVMS